MTYTTHRDTRETLQTLDRLDLDTDRPTDEDIMKKFGLDEQLRSGELTCWQRVKPRVWVQCVCGGGQAKGLGVVCVWWRVKPRVWGVVSAW